MDKPKLFKAWLAFFLVATIGGLVAGALLGGIAGFILAALNGGDPHVVAENRFLFQAGGFLLGIPISFFSYQWSVSRFVLPQVAEKKDLSDPSA